MPSNSHPNPILRSYSSSFATFFLQYFVPDGPEGILRLFLNSSSPSSAFDSSATSVNHSTTRINKKKKKGNWPPFPGPRVWLKESTAFRNFATSNRIRPSSCPAPIRRGRRSQSRNASTTGVLTASVWLSASIISRMRGVDGIDFHNAGLWMVIPDRAEWVWPDVNQRMSTGISPYYVTMSSSQKLNGRIFGDSIK